MESIRIRNEFTNYLNSLLKEEWLLPIKEGYTDGNYILYNGEFCWRVPGITIGDIDVDENHVITGIRVIPSLRLYPYTVPYEELEKDLSNKFIGFKLKLDFQDSRK